MKKKIEIRIGKGLNPMIYKGAKPVDGVKVPVEILRRLVNEGENLANDICKLITGYGHSYYGIFIQTYALTQAYACLKAVAKDEGFDNEKLARYLLPDFEKEAEQMVKKIFSGLEMTWRRLILFAVISGILTGLIALP